MILNPYRARAMKRLAAPFRPLTAIAAFLSCAAGGHAIKLEERTFLLQATHKTSAEPDPMPKNTTREHSSIESHRQSMINFGEAQYVAYMTVGGQLISGILDTGSFELVVFSSACTTCGEAAVYNPFRSSSYGAKGLTTTLAYNSGDAYAEEAFDTVSIGPFSGTNMSFWEITRASMPVLYNAAFQSIIGIGPPETAASDIWTALQKTAGNISNLTGAHKHVPSELLTQVSEQLDVAVELSNGMPPLLKKFNVNMFSICIGAKPGSDGYIIWNDLSAERNPSLFTQVPVVGAHTWSIQLNDVRLSGNLNTSEPDKVLTQPLGCETGCSAILDSGTSLLMVPSSIITKLQDMMRTLDSDCSDLHKLPDLVFDIGGSTFSLPPDAYVGEAIGSVPTYIESYVSHGGDQHQPYRARTQCQLLLIESTAHTSYGPLWIMGLPFFRKYYTTFRVGSSRRDRALFVAPASQDCTPASNVVALSSFRNSEAPLHLRQVDMSMIHVPEVARKAATRSYVQL
jgi:hypothetical protein